MHPLGRRGEEWYFFTPRKRKYPNGDRPDREADRGYWKPTCKEATIIADGMKGFRNSLDYYEGKHPTGKKTDWKMHEFRLHDSIAPPNKKGVNGTTVRTFFRFQIFISFKFHCVPE